MSQVRTIYTGESLLYDMDFPAPPLLPGETLTAVLSVDIVPTNDLTVSAFAAQGSRAQFRVDAGNNAAPGYRDVVVQVQGSLGNTPKGKGVLKVGSL